MHDTVIIISADKNPQKLNILRNVFDLILITEFISTLPDKRLCAIFLHIEINVQKLYCKGKHNYADIISNGIQLMIQKYLNKLSKQSRSGLN